MIKLNINGSPLNGWINISDKIVNPELVKNGETFVPGNTENLDFIVEDATVDEILFGQPINSLTPDNIVNYLQMYAKKLKVGGLLNIYFVDIRKVGLGLYNSSLQLDQAHELIFGLQNDNRSLVDTQTVLALSEKMGFKVDLISPNGYLIKFTLKNANTQN